MTATQTSTIGESPRMPAIEMLDITVLSGGPSAEREVSLQSGQAVFESLKRLGHRVTLSDIGPDDLSALDREADFVFVALHGDFGEDGKVQAELDARGLPYAGSGAVASRLAMDKAAAKTRFREVGIPTPDFAVVNGGNLAGLGSQLSAPVVVKPLASGSSVDTTIVRTDGELPGVAGAVIDKYGEALVERFVDGPELTVAVLGDQALPVCEIRTKREFYDYQAKYIDDDTEYLFDLDLPIALLARVQAMGLAAHKGLGCRVFSRVDFMVDGESMEPYVLEVNTIPGFTSHSLVPKAAARVGLSFDELCQWIVQRSLDGGM